MTQVTPYSLELGKDGDAKDVVDGTTSDIVAGKMKIFFGLDAQLGQRQTLLGNIKNCYRALMDQYYRKGSASSIVAYGQWKSVSAGTVLFTGDPIDVGDGDIAVIVSSTFDDDTTHFADETFKQLVNVFLERTMEN
jgi:hypothetical protein